MWRWRWIRSNRNNLIHKGFEKICNCSVDRNLSRKQDVCILKDSDALIKIKADIRTFNQLKVLVEDELETRPPTEMLSFIKHLREETNMASCTLWSVYSMINSVSAAGNVISNWRLAILPFNYDNNIVQSTNLNW